MSQAITKPESPDHSLLHHEFRWAIAWGWSIIGFFSIISALTSQEKINDWQIYYSVILTITILISIYFHRIFNTAISYAPIPVVLWLSPFFLNDPNQKSWISIGFLAVATIVAITNIEDLRLVIPLILFSIALQQYIATKDLPSITDSNDLLLLHGYFGVSWCLLVGFGLIFIRQGYIGYHDSIDQQLSVVYENQLQQSKSVLAINTADYRNIQLHGTILNTLIYARDNLKLSLSSDRLKLASYIKKDIETFQAQAQPEKSFDRRLRTMLHDLGNREMDVWLAPLPELDIDESTKAQVIEIVREKILNLKKHTLAQNCEVNIEIAPIKLQGISFIRPAQYRLIIEFKDDAAVFSSDGEKEFEGAKNSKSLNRLLNPLNAIESFNPEQLYLHHRIEIPLINFQPNAVEQLFELRRTSQEFIAKSYVLISMFYGAICLPALIRVGAPISILFLSSLIVLGSFASILLTKFNIYITIANAYLALVPLIMTILGSPICTDLQYLPWIFNGLIGPVFFAVLVISNRWLRWIPPILFFIESIYVANQLPESCRGLLAGSSPGIVVLSFLALLVLNIRKRNTKKDQELIQQYRRDSNRFLETKVRIQQEQEEIIELLAKFSASIAMSKTSAEGLKQDLNLFILQIRALLVSTEYFDSKLVQAIYFLVKQRIMTKKFTELHILSDKFNEFEKDDSFTQLDKMLKFRDKDQVIKISVVSADKTEIRVAKIQSNSSLRSFFEDKKVRILRN